LRLAVTAALIESGLHWNEKRAAHHYRASHCERRKGTRCASNCKHDSLVSEPSWSIRCETMINK
jgi:hypothetical protein